MSGRNFGPRIIEPILPSGETGYGIELEFHSKIPGLNGDTFIIQLSDKISFETAKKIRNLLAEFRDSVLVTNPI